MRDPMHTTVCDRCYQGTWYDTEQPCKRSRELRCPCCHQTTGKYVACGGTLRVIDRSMLDARFAPYYESGERIRVRLEDGETMHGTVGKTTGWRPVYLLMRAVNARGSSVTLDASAIIVAVKVTGSHVYRQVAY